MNKKAKSIGESPPVRDGSVLTGELQRGACNQGKGIFEFLLRQFGHTPCPLLLERMFSSGTKDYISTL